MTSFLGTVPAKHKPFHIGIISHGRVMSKKGTYAYCAEHIGHKATARTAEPSSIRKPPGVASLRRTTCFGHFFIRQLKRPCLIPPRNCQTTVSEPSFSFRPKAAISCVPYNANSGSTLESENFHFVFAHPPSPIASRCPEISISQQHLKEEWRKHL